MGLKSQLIAELNGLVSKDRQGSYQGRLMRQKQMIAIINDMIGLGLAPEHLHTLRSKHLVALVSHWKSQKLSHSTIINKVGIFKRFCALCDNVEDFPSNDVLELKRSDDSKPKRSLSAALINAIAHPLIKSIAEFEVYFGLTKLESIRIQLKTAIQRSDIVISRALSFNARERIIPILSADQKKAVEFRKSLLGSKLSLTDILDERTLSVMYDGEINYLGYSRQKLRVIYASMRANRLMSAYQNDYDAVKSVLRDELGYVSNKNLTKALNL